MWTLVWHEGMIGRMHHSLVLLIALFLQLAVAPTESIARDERRELAVPADDSWRRPDLVLEALAVQPGETVVDLGAGSGYYVGPLATLVGRRGTVYATDIDESSLRGLEGLKATHGFSQMVIIRGAHQSSGLPPNSVNAVLLSHPLRELKHPVQFLYNLKQALKRNARIVIVDYHRTDDGFYPPKQRRIELSEAKRVIHRAGYRITASKEIPRQYLLICEPN